MDLRRVPLALVAAIASASIGCHVYAEPEPVTVTSGSVVPANIETYPSTYYDGHPVYIYDNRYWYRDRGRWTYYRNPPPPLVRQRPYVQQAPPSYGPSQGTPRYESQPPNYVPPQSAPPATRVQ